MSLRGTWHVVQQSIPAPAWVKWPDQQRFCCCCSIRTGASLIGWFNFIVNSVYVGMLILAMTNLRNILDQTLHLPSEFSDTSPNPDDFEGSVAIASEEDATASYPSPDKELREFMLKMIDHTLPLIYQSIAIPGLMIIFSVLWLITVEARSLGYVRFFGRAFIFAIVVQILLQIGFLAYVEVQSRSATGHGIDWFIWLVFAFYALINMYFVPVLSEYIKRIIKESNQGLEQGLLTSEMYPKSRVAEEYIEDAFTLECDSEVVRFEASLAETNTTSYGAHEVTDDYQPI